MFCVLEDDFGQNHNIHPHTALMVIVANDTAFADQINTGMKKALVGFSEIDSNGILNVQIFYFWSTEFLLTLLSRKVLNIKWLDRFFLTWLHPLQPVVICISWMQGLLLTLLLFVYFSLSRPQAEADRINGAKAWRGLQVADSLEIPQAGANLLSLLEQQYAQHYRDFLAASRKSDWRHIRQVFSILFQVYLFCHGRDLSRERGRRDSSLIAILECRWAQYQGKDWLLAILSLFSYDY